MSSPPSATLPRPAASPTTLYVCVTCRVEGDASEIRAGRRLHDALLAGLGADPDVRLVAVECLSACRRPCAASLTAPDKWTYVYGDLPAEAAAPVLVETARLYGAAPDGLIPWKLRADAIKKGSVARVPPFSLPNAPPMPPQGAIQSSPEISPESPLESPSQGSQSGHTA